MAALPVQGELKTREARWQIFAEVRIQSDFGVFSGQIADQTADFAQQAKFVQRPSLRPVVVAKIVPASAASSRRMESDTKPSNDKADARAIAVFKALAAFSGERHGFAGVDDLDHCHWSDVARMIRKAAVNDPTDQAAPTQALRDLDSVGISPHRLSSSLAGVARAITRDGEMTVGGMTLQVMHEIARRRRLGPGRRSGRRGVWP